MYLYCVRYLVNITSYGRVSKYHGHTVVQLHKISYILRTNYKFLPANWKLMHGFAK